ncbi:MAG TPA: hypothetical protein VG273_10310 [Bryobacteraceae bacterium]|jgi:uncharacterized membrane protein|nr:hypothetical protein [Bryobacteraceae bacterium]
MKTVAAVFPSLTQASRASRDLEKLGVPREDISLIAGNDSRRHDEYLEKARKASAPTEAAAASGASMGAGLGILATLAALAIPGVGAVYALGPLLTIFAGGGVGAATGGLIGAFHNMGISHEEAPIYEEAVRRGAIMIAAVVRDEVESAAVEALKRDGGVDVRDQKDPWNNAEWSGPDHDPHPYVSASGFGEENG